MKPSTASYASNAAPAYVTAGHRRRDEARYDHRSTRSPIPSPTTMVCRPIEKIDGHGIRGQDNR